MGRSLREASFFLVTAAIAACSSSTEAPGSDAGTGGGRASGGAGGTNADGGGGMGGSRPTTGGVGGSIGGAGGHVDGGDLGSGGASGGSGGSDDGGASQDAGDASSPDGSTGSGGTSSGGSSGSGGSGGGCSGVSIQAATTGAKADVIWAIDTSGSMLTELNAVQSEMNAFSAWVLGKGIDLRVVVIADASRDLFGVVVPGFCAPPPLGSGACLNAGDNNPPLYTHVAQVINSQDALLQLMGTYPQWQNTMRTDSTKTFVVVTDDDAGASPTVPEFRAFFDAAFTAAKWRFSGVYCRGVSANCYAAGTQYDTLLNATGGVWSDLGNADLNGRVALEQIANAVVTSTAGTGCEWSIPPPPSALSFDRNKLNVDFTPSSGPKETFVQVTASTCPANGYGWFYDNEDPPTTILACPQTCTKIRSATGASVDIRFGCESNRSLQ